MRNNVIDFEIPDSLIQHKVDLFIQSVSRSIPVLHLGSPGQWPKGEESVSVFPYITGAGWIYLSLLIILIGVIIFIFRRKKRSK